MDWGMESRLGQLIQADGRCLFLPVDHGYFQGPIRKLENPRKTLEPLLPYTDAIFITRGVLRACVDPDKTKPVILRVSGGTSVAGKDLAHEGITTSMEEAIWPGLLMRGNGMACRSWQLPLWAENWRSVMSAILRYHVVSLLSWALEWSRPITVKNSRRLPRAAPFL
jgi:DhnA family fructose-bisphosphate aldolase class Ia